MSNYYFVIVGATDNPIYESEIIPSSRSSAFIDPSRVTYVVIIKQVSKTNNSKRKIINI